MQHHHKYNQYHGKRIKNSGYTLVALMFVIVVIAVALMYSASTSQRKSRRTAVTLTVQNLSNQREALQNYYWDHGAWPTYYDTTAYSYSAGPIKNMPYPNYGFYGQYYPQGNLYTNTTGGTGLNYLPNSGQWHNDGSSGGGNSGGDGGAVNYNWPIGLDISLTTLNRNQPYTQIRPQVEIFNYWPQPNSMYDNALFSSRYLYQPYIYPDLPTSKDTAGQNAAYIPLILSGIDDVDTANEIQHYFPGFYAEQKQQLITLVAKPLASNFLDKVGRVLDMGTVWMFDRGFPNLDSDDDWANHANWHRWSDSDGSYYYAKNKDNQNQWISTPVAYVGETDLNQYIYNPYSVTRISMPACTSGNAKDDGTLFYPRIFFAPYSWRTGVQVDQDGDVEYNLSPGTQRLYKATCDCGNHYGNNYGGLSPTSGQNGVPGYWLIGFQATARLAAKSPTGSGNTILNPNHAQATLMYFTTCSKDPDPQQFLPAIGPLPKRFDKNDYNYRTYGFYDQWYPRSAQCYCPNAQAPAEKYYTVCTERLAGDNFKGARSDGANGNTIYSECKWNSPGPSSEYNS